jgi:hypothetical protein
VTLICVHSTTVIYPLDLMEKCAQVLASMAGLAVESLLKVVPLEEMYQQF